MSNFKKGKILERYFKGVANHRRIDILVLISKNDGITVEQISESLDCNFKTISDHIRRLVVAGLVYKNYKGTKVMHALSSYGKLFITFLKSF